MAARVAAIHASVKTPRTRSHGTGGDGQEGSVPTRLSALAVTLDGFPVMAARVAAIHASAGARYETGGGCEFRASAARQERKHEVRCAGQPARI
jgi:hypothetical protein